MHVEPRGDRGVMLLIHGRWLPPSVWTPWLAELDEAGYDAVVLSWSDGDLPSGNGRPPVVKPGFNALLQAARRHVEAFPSRPIVIGHGVGGAVAERLLNDGDAAAAISLAPVPGGYPAIPAAVRLVRREAPLAMRHRAPARSRQPRRGPLLLVAGGKDELIREMSIALLHRDYRRHQRDAVTDYKVFPDMDHTLGLGTSDVDVLFYCLDWLTAQNM
jgi:alpha-beta hydrolase superfamily lysophospholipase